MYFSTLVRTSNTFLSKSEIPKQYVRFKSLVRNTSQTIKSMEQGNKICKVTSLDHLVLTVKDIDKAVLFYTNAMGMSLVKFGEGRMALQFGTMKINLHKAGKEFKPHANKPTPGSADLCFITKIPLAEWISNFKQVGVQVIEGPVKRSGAMGTINSIYVRDPDENLVEIAVYD